MILTDTWVAYLQDFAVIEGIFLLHRYIQKQINFKRSIKDLLIALLFAGLYLLFADAALLILVLGRLVWHFWRQKSYQIKNTDTATFMVVTSVQLMLFSVAIAFGQFCMSVVESNYSATILAYQANEIALIGTAIAVLFDLIFWWLLKIKRTEVDQINQKITNFALERQFFWFSFGLFLALESILTIGNLQEVTATIQLAIIVIFGILIGVTCWQVVIFLKAYALQQEAADQFERNQQLQDYLVNIEQQYTELRRFKHDYRNMLLSLESFAQQGNQQQFKAYYQELLAQQPMRTELQGAIIAQLNYLKNEPIRGLIIQKFLAAKQVGVTLNFEMTAPVTLPATNLLTVIRIIGILLDNAIEQATQEPDQNVNCALIQSTGLVEITIENQATQVADVQQLFQLGYTTKGTNHGTGLANVKELVAKQANLFFETQIKGQRLRQTLMVTEEN